MILGDVGEWFANNLMGLILLVGGVFLFITRGGFTAGKSASALLTSIENLTSAMTAQKKATEDLSAEVRQSNIQHVTLRGDMNVIEAELRGRIDNLEKGVDSLTNRLQPVVEDVARLKATR